MKDQILDEADSVLLQFSGGKDSIATALYCLPWKDKITVLFCDMGDSFPHVISYVRQFCIALGYNLVILKNPVPIEDFWEEYGVPTDIVPIWNTPFGLTLGVTEGKKLQSGFDCCYHRLWNPMETYTIGSKASVVVRGAKRSDPHVGIQNLTSVNGQLYYFPIWEWTKEQVLKFVADMGVTLPHQYNNGCCHSLDCMRCTAWLGPFNSVGAANIEMERVEYTRKFYPSSYEYVNKNIQEIQEIVKEYYSKIQTVLR